MVVTNQVKNQHLLWRAGFGPSTGEIAGLASQSVGERFSAMLKESKKKPVYLDVAANSFQGLFMGLGEIKRAKEQNASDEKNSKREMARASREAIKSLNIAWLNEMSDGKAQLREKMSLFWHGHFACRNLNIYFQQLLLHNIRENSLGNFGDLLSAVSKSAGMLAFLNNQQNRKSHPNENFAREVMELFTLGRGNYTEHDVKEAARAFTGWGFNLQGEYVFRPFQHDRGSKTILGKTGNFDGDDVINLLLEQKQTARLLTKKIYRFFVNDVVDEQHTNWLADRFYQSGYKIDQLMTDIFTSDWFYDKKNVGCIIKSPVELLAGLKRTIPIQIQNEEVQLLFQRALGQILFYPPNVAGWPGGKNWIDSSALMLRLRLPQLMAGNDIFNIKPKTDDDQQMGMADKSMAKASMAGMGAGKRFAINSQVDWSAFAKQFDSVPRQQLYNVLEAVLLQTNPGSIAADTVEKVVDKSSRETYIKTTALALMSTPEYQLC